MAQLTLSFRGKTLKVFPLSTDEIMIGSDPNCAIHIDSLALEPQHARIIRRDEQWLVQDLDTPQHTFLNDKPVQEQALKSGDMIRVGKHNLTFDEGGPEPSSPPAPPPPMPREKKAWLQILSGQNVGRTVHLTRQLTTLGHPGTQTAGIAHRNDGYYLSHLEGNQTPLLNDQAIGDTTRHLRDGDIIQIGNVKMQFYLQ